MKLPEKFVEQMGLILKSELNDFLQALQKENVKSLTVDFNKITREKFEKLIELEEINIKKIDYINNAYVYDGKIGKTVLSHAGIVYSQDSSAMLPVEALGVEKGDYVLDVCASPGGKSIQILQKLNGSGLLVSNEYVYNRAKILYENLVRFSYANYIITNNLPSGFDKNKQLFDKIIIDAPCSGEGMFRKQDIDTCYWNEKNVQTCAIRQLEILNSVKGLLKKGGKLVYSTCTYNLEENEKVVATFLNNNPNFKLLPLPKHILNNTTKGIDVLGQTTSLTGKRFPHKHNGEGQFIALFEKIDGEEVIDSDFKVDNYKLIKSKDKDVLLKNLSFVENLENCNYYSRGDNLYVAPVCDLDFTGLNVISLGVYLGNFKKNILDISHSFYKAFGKYFKNKIELNLIDAKTYLTGNVINANANDGIAVVTYNGVVLGGGKVVGGTLKNYYPKELRNK